MNAHQRRKQRRRQHGPYEAPHRLVRNWEELAQVPESKTHRLDIDVEGCNGWIVEKGKENDVHIYLSTHTFYGSTHQDSTRRLRRCGFNVTIANWDAGNSKAED